MVIVNREHAGMTPLGMTFSEMASMIGDETVTEDAEALMNYLTEKGHPVLGMDPLM